MASNLRGKTSPASVLKAAANLPQPPYGLICTDLEEALIRPSVPDNFQIRGVAGTRADWHSLLDDVINHYANELWPRYDAGTRAWVGNAAATMDDLTRADLALAIALARKLPDAVQVGDDVDDVAEVTHLTLFQEEETMRPPFYASASHYLTHLTEAEVAALRDEMTKGIRAIGSQPLKLKLAMQRPRPYQMAYLLGIDFHYEDAGSAMTPALPSGHCLQGLFAGTFAYLALRRTLMKRPEAIRQLQRYCVAPGDRRVMGGVHYPSDNLASFYLDLRLCDHVFGEAGQIAKDFMVESIRASLSYQDMVKVQGPYAKALGWIAAEMARKADF